MVDEPVWQPLSEEDLRRVRVLLVRGFLATLAALCVVGAAVDALDLGKPRTGTGLEPTVYGLYRPGTVSDLRCDENACSYRRGRWVCTYDGGTRPDCSLPAERKRRR